MEKIAFESHAGRLVGRPVFARAESNEDEEDREPPP